MFFVEITTLQESRIWIKQELDRCLTFWMTHGEDKVHGGTFTCLDREGNLYSTDKSVWMQGRSAWTFAYLCKEYGMNEAWRTRSKNCLDFLEQHCINRQAGGRMYFTVTQEGHPLRQRRYCFSEGFYAIGNGEYYGITQEPGYLERARGAYELIYQCNQGGQDPVGFPPKTIPETRATRGLADPMIYLNITSVLRRVDPERADLYHKRAQECVHQIFAYHHKPDLECTLESVALDGTPELHYTAGRTLNPGHAMECAWFLMEEANNSKDKALHEKACEMLRFAYRRGWDAEYGGILYFVDCLGKPPESYEHDMKLWWPHNEAMIACLMAYRDTKDEMYWNWFQETLAYSKAHFADPEFGEWFGYLRRDGKPTQPSTKGSTFKGAFHLPRMLIMVDKILEGLILEQSQS